MDTSRLKICTNRLLCVFLPKRAMIEMTVPEQRRKWRHLQWFVESDTKEEPKTAYSEAGLVDFSVCILGLLDQVYSPGEYQLDVLMDS